MSKNIRKQSISSNESISTMDSRAYSTDKSRSDSSSSNRFDSTDDLNNTINNIVIDISNNVELKEGWGFPIKKEEEKKKKRRLRDVTYKPRRTPTPTINFDYGQFISIEEIKK